MGNTFCVTRKVASRKHRNGKVLEFVVPVFANEVLEKAKSKRHLSPANHELESGSMYHPQPDAESVVASKRGSCRIKLVITKRELRELVSKRISVQDVIEVRKAEDWCSNWKPELKSIPEDDELGWFL